MACDPSIHAIRSGTIPGRHNYIRRDDPGAARQFRQRAEQILRRLGQFPGSGRAIPEFPELPYREVIIAPYRFFYRTGQNTVWVVGVWHGAQLPDEPIG